MDAVTCAWLVLAFPLAGSILISLSFKVLPRRAAGYIGTVAIGIAFAFAVAALIGLLSHPVEERSLHGALYDYAAVAGIDVELSILVDPLSVFMCLIVTGVSTLIHLYSLAYMTSDRGYNRFFSYLNFFVFSMLLLVLAGNLVLLIVGWAFVGFASYALISFWYRRSTATAAGMKAFVINVVGDIGLVLAAFLILREIGALDLTEIFENASSDLTVNSGVAVAIGLLLLVGAFAKSAQIPLHTWLADAMEGPTPVSALIHAATMVTAGVYLIARFWPIFELAPTAADVAAFIGLATLLFAGTVALVVTDLKRIIAYSTISQIGYMVVGVSIGAYTAGMFHLMTHAFFKALLFMAAGSVIAHHDDAHGLALEVGGGDLDAPVLGDLDRLGPERAGGGGRDLLAPAGLQHEVDVDAVLDAAQHDLRVGARLRAAARAVAGALVDGQRLVDRLEGRDRRVAQVALEVLRRGEADEQGARALGGADLQDQPRVLELRRDVGGVDRELRRDDGDGLGRGLEAVERDLQRLEVADVADDADPQQERRQPEEDDQTADDVPDDAHRATVPGSYRLRALPARCRGGDGAATAVPGTPPGIVEALSSTASRRISWRRRTTSGPSSRMRSRSISPCGSGTPASRRRCRCATTSPSTTSASTSRPTRAASRPSASGSTWRRTAAWSGPPRRIRRGPGRPDRLGWGS